MKMYHKHLMLALISSFTISSLAAQAADNQSVAPPTWQQIFSPSAEASIPVEFMGLRTSLKFSNSCYLVIPVIASWTAGKLYRLYALPIDIEAMESRLLRLESATNGILAQRHAGMETVRSEKYSEKIWRLSDQLLELRSELSIPEFKAYDATIQKCMLDKIDALYKRLELVTKIKAAVAA